MKAISLPMNAVVIIALAVLALIAIVLMFTSTFTPAATEATKQSILRNCCTRIATNCEAYTTVGGENYNDKICSIPDYLKDSFKGKIDDFGRVTISDLASYVGVNVKDFCGC